MGLWQRFLGNHRHDLKPQRLDYLNEALALERQGDFDAALTSYRLALRDNPSDPRILQNMAIALTKTGQTDEAVRYYRLALDHDAQLPGSHYGLAFLLLAKGETGHAAAHLRQFLAQPPRGPDAERWISHARNTLDGIENPEHVSDGGMTNSASGL